MVVVTTAFTRRTGGYVFPETTTTNNHTALVNNWHKNAFGQQDVDYECSEDGPKHKAKWEAVPTSE
jgi:hypothetical protein